MNLDDIITRLETNQKEDADWNDGYSACLGDLRELAAEGRSDFVVYQADGAERCRLRAAGSWSPPAPDRAIKPAPVDIEGLQREITRYAGLYADEHARHREAVNRHESTVTLFTSAADKLAEQATEIEQLRRTQDNRLPMTRELALDFAERSVRDRYPGYERGRNWASEWILDAIQRAGNRGLK